MKGGLFLMKRCLLTSMLLILISFSVFTGPSEKIAHYSFNSKDEHMITTVETITSTHAITESVQTVIQKWQTPLLFPPADSIHVLKEKFIPFQPIDHAIFSGKIAGFICVVQHQSNYLPTL